MDALLDVHVVVTSSSPLLLDAGLLDQSITINAGLDLA